MKELVVEGWRGIAHSYAVVNEHQLLALCRQPHIRLYHRDLPFYGGHWRSVSGLWPAAEAAALAQLSEPPAHRVQALYRIGFPYDLTPALADRTIVFGTSELLSVTDIMLARPGNLAEQMAGTDTVIVTPSRWSQQGFVSSGAPVDRVAVVPHGVEPAVYRALDADRRTTLRQRLGWDPYFIFLSVGTMKGNKGLMLMLKALAALTDRYPDVRLVLKGSDALYDSKRLVTEMADTLSEGEKQTVLDRIFYLGDALSFSAMAQLYQAADAYVTPYMAEGFNLPALEAAACGLPVVCTRGGPTDDFAHPRFFLGVDSRLKQKRVSAQAETKVFLVPDQDHLIERMIQLIGDTDLRNQSRELLPAWVHERYSWDVVSRQLLDILFPGS